MNLKGNKTGLNDSLDIMRREFMMQYKDVMLESNAAGTSTKKPHILS